MSVLKETQVRRLQPHMLIFISTKKEDDLLSEKCQFDVLSVF